MDFLSYFDQLHVIFFLSSVLAELIDLWMGSKPWLHPAPEYRYLESYWDTDEDAPGPRCSHTLTAVAATKTHGPRLILFGGATAIASGNGGIRNILSFDFCFLIFVLFGTD